jgi:hypothetical protein
VLPSHGGSVANDANLLGECDFNKLLDNKPLRFDLARIFQWKYEPTAKESVG